jgi:uncharacterized protein (TIGR02217 family)
MYVDIPFPPRIAFGAQRRPGWSTIVVMVESGLTRAEERWEQARHQFDISFAIRTVRDYSLIQDHFHQMRARARTFPFPDPLDNVTVRASGVLLPVDDPDTPTIWQLAKRYGTGDAAWFRLITRPVAPIVYRTRAGVTTSIAGSATVDLSNGGVVISPAALAPGDLLSWAGGFMVPCRYDVDELPGSIENREPGPDGELYVRVASIPVIEDKEKGRLGEFLESEATSS